MPNGLQGRGPLRRQNGTLFRRHRHDAAKPEVAPAKPKPEKKAKGGARAAQGASGKGKASKKATAAKAAPKGKKTAKAKETSAPREGSKTGRVLTTNTDLPASEIALKYKQLWMVEEVFRSMKSLLDTSRTLRAGQRADDQQPAVLEVGRDFQRRDDDGGGE